MRARDIAGDGKPEPGAAFVLVARVVEPKERLEYFLAHGRGNTGTIVVDGDRQIAMVAVPGDRDHVGETRRVRHEIGEAPLECRGPHRHDRLAVNYDRRLMPVTFGIRAQLVEEHRHIGRRRLLAAVAAGKGEIGLDHPRHLIDVFLELLDAPSRRRAARAAA